MGEQKESATSNSQVRILGKEKASVELKDNSIWNSPVRFALSNIDVHRRARVLDLYAPDQDGLLSVLCETLMSNSLDVEHAKLETKNGVCHVQIVIYVPVDEREAEESMIGLENGAKSMCQALANRETVCDFGMQKTLQHYVNPDLLRVTSFRELPSNETELLQYEIGLQGIDQAGLLAYTSVLFARCRFSIAKASISTKDGHISDLFELTTASLKAVDLLRSQLDLPGDNQFREEDLTSLPFSSCVNQKEFKCEQNHESLLTNPSENAGGSQSSTASPHDILSTIGSLESSKVSSVCFPNGDEYRGGTKQQIRHGYGTYTYNKKSHGVFKQYKGQWLNDMKHGYGVLMCRNGNVYAGQWEENAKRGIGVMFQCKEGDPQGLPSFKYEGQWSDDAPHGYGVEESQDALYYGRFIHGERCGPGMDLKHNKISECKVHDGIEWLPLIETLQATRSQFADKSGRRRRVTSSMAFSSPPKSVTPTQGSAEQTFISAGITTDDSTPLQSQTLKQLFATQSSQGNHGFQMSTPVTTATLQVSKMTPCGLREPQMLVQEESLAVNTAISVRDTLLGFHASPAPMSPNSLPTSPTVQLIETESGEGEVPTVVTSPTNSPVRCPTLWGEPELAAFLSCLGISESVTNLIRQHQIRGPARLLEKSNRDMHLLGLTDPVQRLLVRKSLQRLLEIDRYENIVVGQRIGDVVGDTVLCSHIIPLEAITISSSISQGGYGQVFRGTLRPCHRSTDPKRQDVCNIALKEMKGAQQKIQLHELLKEAHVLASLHHKNVCRFLGVCANRSPQGKRYIISELMDCSLFDLIHSPHKLRWRGDLNLALANSLSIDICDGITYLHQKKLVHADLKSSNILVDFSATPIVPKICDFGHAAIRPFPAPHSRCGTPHWAAPEALRGEALSEAADMYSFGVIFWEMITKKVPHYGLSTCQVLATVGWAGLPVDLDLIKNCPEGIESVIEACLSNTPSKRPTAKIAKNRLRRVKSDVKHEALAMLKDFFG